MKTKVESAIAALDKIPTTCELEEKLVAAAKDLLMAMRKYKAGSLEEATHLIASAARTADQSGVELVGEAMGEQFGPFAISPSTNFQYN